MPVEGAAVGVLGFDGNGTWGVFVEYGFHGILQSVEVGDGDVGFFVDGFDIDVAVAEALPGEVVKEKVWARFIGHTGPAEVVGLDVVDVGNVVEEFVTFAGLT